MVSARLSQDQHARVSVTAALPVGFNRTIRGRKLDWGQMRALAGRVGSDRIHRRMASGPLAIDGVTKWQQEGEET